MRRHYAAFIDWLLGPRCPACRIRVFPADQINHPNDCETS